MTFHFSTRLSSDLFSKSLCILNYVLFALKSIYYKLLYFKLVIKSPFPEFYLTLSKMLDHFYSFLFLISIAIHLYFHCIIYFLKSMFWSDKLYLIILLEMFVDRFIYLFVIFFWHLISFFLRYLVFEILLMSVLWSLRHRINVHFHKRCLRELFSIILN